MTLDHRDTISRASQSLKALASFVDSPDDDEVQAGLAFILMRIAEDLDGIEAQVKREAEA